MFKKKVTDEMIKEGKRMLDEGGDGRDVAMQWGMSLSTVRRYLREEVHDATEEKWKRLQKRGKI